MPRVIGVDIPGKKRIEYALRYIYGVGPTRAKELVERLKISPSKKADELTGEEIAGLSKLLQEEYVVEGDLRREVSGNIRRLIAVNCYRGIRHRKGLPVRGQRTSTNARTRKGPRKTVGAVRGKEARSAVKGAGPAPAAAPAAAAPASK
jgi:small subunit ribosomal protein S13